MDTINQRVAQYRKLAGLNQTEVAEKLGIKCSTYSQMERKGKITAERLLMLADIFNVEPEEILYEKKKSDEGEVLPPPKPEPKTRLGQPPFYENPNFIPPFICSKKEEDLVKIIRLLSKEDKEAVVLFIEQKYNNLRKKN